MSNEEHYFENLLFAYSRGGDDMNKVKKNDSNIQYLDNDVKHAIETCATYIIDCCGWDSSVLRDFLHGNFITPSVESSSQ